MITQDRTRAAEILESGDAPDKTWGLRSFHLRSTAARPPLAIGLLLDGPACPRFVARILEDITESDFARLELVVVNGGNGPPPTGRLPLPKRLSRVVRDAKARRLLLYELYVKFDGGRLPADDDPLALVDCRPLLAGVESLTVQPLVKGFTHRVAPVDLDRIRARQLDVLLRFGFNILRGDILQAARCGVWSFHHGDNDHYRGGPAGFWELYEGSPVSGVMLQVLTDELDAGLVLCKSYFATARGASLARNRYGPYWGSTHFVIEKLHELHEHGWEHVRARAEPPGPYRGRRATYKRPTNLEMAKFFGRAAARFVVRAARSTRHARWQLAVRIGARPLYETEGRAPMNGFAWIECPPGHSYADPFLMAREGTTWAFFRASSEAPSRGRIACAEVLPSGALGLPRTCLGVGHDLSYPMIFESDGETFMIPGSAESSTVDLYRARSFPYEWTLEKSLHRIRAVNTTVCRAAGRWWFFAAVAEPPGHCATLLLFHAESLTGPWVYHPANPISSDVRNARGAGAIFRARGRRIRPSHALGPRGEHRFSLNEILELTPEAYRERPMLTVEPSWATAVMGTATYAQWAGIEVVDGCTMARRARPAVADGVDPVCVGSRE